MTTQKNKTQDIPLSILREYFEKMYLIRQFESRLLRLFSEGKLFGTTHTYIGQEPNAVGVISHLKPDDIIVSNHRCHGHYLVFKNKSYELICELMGKEDGINAGRGGSQHLCDGNFFSNGVQGGGIPLACGLAFAEKYKKSDKIIAAFIGDGTFGQGVIYEGFNIASLWELPILIVVENNRYAQSTKIEHNLAGSISVRFDAFGIKSNELSTFDVREISPAAKEAVKFVREFKKPYGLILNTYRFASHSTSDDGRAPEEIELWKQKDGIPLIEKELDAAEIKRIKKFVDERLKREVKRAQEAADATGI